MGIILFLVQIIIYIRYERKYPTIRENNYSSTIEIAERKEGKENIIKIEDQSNNKEWPVKIITKSINK